MTRLVLASTSPARLSVLRAAGIEPTVIAPIADEEDLTREALQANPALTASELVQLLAVAKAESVLEEPLAQGALVLGGDSALEFRGQTLGKPHHPDIALERWRELSGNWGVLHSGHCLIDNRDPENPKTVGGPSATRVHFATLTDREMQDYVATGEPLKVAGAFTIDGLGGAFIEKIEGDAHTVIGLSLHRLRELAQELGVHYPSLWR